MVVKNFMIKYYPRNIVKYNIKYTYLKKKRKKEASHASMKFGLKLGQKFTCYAIEEQNPLLSLASQNAPIDVELRAV